MSPVGVIRLNIQSAHILPWSRLRGSSPDPFISICLSDAVEVGHTSHKLHEFDPTWMETKFIVLNSLNEILCLALFDHHEHRKHTLLGMTSFNLSKLRENAAQGGLHLPLIHGDKLKHRGELLIDLIFYPVAEAISTEPESQAGIVSLHLPMARNLEMSKSTSGHLNSIASISLGYSEDITFVTPCLDGVNPAWDWKHNFFCPRKSSLVIVVKINNDNQEDLVLGQLSLRLDDLLEGNDKGVECWPLSGCKSGELLMSAVWRPLKLDS